MKRKRPTSAGSTTSVCQLSTGSRQTSIAGFFGAKANQLKRPVQRTAANEKSAKSKTTQQLFLDVGQKDIENRRTCEICGMVYVRGMDEDQKQHQRVCRDYRLGVKFPTKQCRVVKRMDEDRWIVEVRSSDSELLKSRLCQVEKIVDDELGFTDNQPSKHRRSFIYLYKERAMGFLQAESIDSAYRLDGESNRHERSQPAMLGIYKLWVHPSVRRQSVSTAMLDTIRSVYFYDLTVPINKVAFSSPSASGLAFARSYTDKGNAAPVLVYDCL